MKNPHQKAYLFLLLIILSSCTRIDPPPHDHSHKKNHDQHDHGSANEYMHKKPVSELIERFESDERNAYQEPEKVMDFLGELEGKKVMDIGAGSGYFSFKLLDRGAKVIAADVDDEFQEYIRQKKEEEYDNTDDLELRKIPYDDPGLKEQEVDIVLIVNTYHHIENRIPYFKKVRKGINTGGKLVIIDYYKKELPVGPPFDHKINKETVISELTESGFSSIKLNEELLEYQYIIVAKR